MILHDSEEIGKFARTWIITVLLCWWHWQSCYRYSMLQQGRHLNGFWISLEEIYYRVETLIGSSSFDLIAGLFSIDPLFNSDNPLATEGIFLGELGGANLSSVFLHIKTTCTRNPFRLSQKCGLLVYISPPFRFFFPCNFCFFSS